MSEKEIQAKIAELQKETLALRKEIAFSFKLAIIIYIILAVFVAGYLAVVGYLLHERATPANIAQLMIDQVKDQLPGVRASVREKMPVFAKRAADGAAAAVQNLIPSTGEYVRNTLDVQTDELLADFEQKHFPAVQQALDETLASVMKEEAAAKEEDKNKKPMSDVLADAIIASVEKEMDKMVNQDFYNTLTNLQKDLDTLRTTPYKQMTRKQYSEFSFIVCWVRLNEIAQSGKDGGFLTSLASFADQASEVLSVTLKPAEETK